MGFAGEPAPDSGETPFVIACVYADGTLDSAWFRAYRRIKQTVRRASFGAHVALVPMSAIPSPVDLLVVPPSLSGLVTAAVPVQRHLVVLPEDAQRVFDATVERLVSDGFLKRIPPPSRSTAVHRGFFAPDGRARTRD
jgi:hypothetical protein